MKDLVLKCFTNLFYTGCQIKTSPELPYLLENFNCRE
jgi:hypothetical protein